MSEREPLAVIKLGSLEKKRQQRHFSHTLRGSVNGFLDPREGFLARV